MYSYTGVEINLSHFLRFSRPEISLMALVFQYGSNADSSRINSNDRLRGDARQVGIAFTADDHELDFTVWSNCNQCAAADIVSGSGRKIWGVLYEIPDHLIRRQTSGVRRSLDEIEGEGANYKRVPIALRHPDGTVLDQEVITYVVINRQGGIQTSLEYASHIVFGLRGHDVREEYIQYVKGRIIANNPAVRDEIENL